MKIGRFLCYVSSFESVYEYPVYAQQLLERGHYVNIKIVSKESKLFSLIETNGF